MWKYFCRHLHSSLTSMKTSSLALANTLCLKYFPGNNLTYSEKKVKKFYNVLTRFGILVLSCLFGALAARVFEEKTLDQKIDGKYWNKNYI